MRTQTHVGAFMRDHLTAITGNSSFQWFGLIGRGRFHAFPMAHVPTPSGACAVCREPIRAIDNGVVSGDVPTHYECFQA